MTHDEEGRQQLVTRQPRRERLEHVDPPQVLDGIAHLGQRERELLASGAELEGRRRALVKLRGAVDATGQLRRVVADERDCPRAVSSAAPIGTPISSASGRRDDSVAHPGPDHHAQDDDRANGQAARQPQRCRAGRTALARPSRAVRAARRDRSLLGRAWSSGAPAFQRMSWLDGDGRGDHEQDGERGPRQAADDPRRQQQPGRPALRGQRQDAAVRRRGAAGEGVRGATAAPRAAPGTD